MSFNRKSYYIIYVLVGVLIFSFGVILLLKSNIELAKKEPDIKKYSIYLGIAGSLIASGIVYILDLIKDIFKSNLQRKISNIIISAGIEEVYKKRDLDKYDILIKNLSNSLDISGYSLNAFNDSYSHILKKKLEKDSSIKIRILLVTPKSNYSKDRETQENNSEFTYLNSVNKTIDLYNKFDNVCIKIIDTPLTTMFYRIDNIIFVGPHLFKRPSKSTITYELNNSGWLYDEYQNDFDNLWNSGIVCKERLTKV